MLRDRVPGQYFVAQADQPDCPGGHNVLPHSSPAAARRTSVNPPNIGPAAHFLVLPLRVMRADGGPSQLPGRLGARSCTMPGWRHTG
jgi:hypothetical protein